MKTNDKFLLGIITGIVVLILVALVASLNQPEPTYQAEDTPEGVAHNYLLALKMDDYERAYSYLSTSLKGYPKSIDDFTANIHRYSWSFRNMETVTTLSIDTSRIFGGNATVTVRESHFRGSDLFDTRQSNFTFDMELHQEKGRWKIVYSPYYYAWCWNEENGCQ